MLVAGCWLPIVGCWVVWAVVLEQSNKRLKAAITEVGVHLDRDSDSAPGRHVNVKRRDRAPATRLPSHPRMLSVCLAGNVGMRQLAGLDIKTVPSPANLLSTQCLVPSPRRTS